MKYILHNDNFKLGNLQVVPLGTIVGITNNGVVLFNSEEVLHFNSKHYGGLSWGKTYNYEWNHFRYLTSDHQEDWCFFPYELEKTAEGEKFLNDCINLDLSFIYHEVTKALEEYHSLID